MELPDKKASYRKRVRFGRHVMRKLLRDKHDALAADARAATDLVKQLGRAWEDADDDEYEAQAGVEGADIDLDGLGQEGRNALGGRGVDAIHQEPYTLIYPWGIGYYTAAPIAEQVSRYRYLALQLTTHLAEDDHVRASAAQIEAGVVVYEAARAQLELAERARIQAAAALARAEAAFDTLMDKIYSTLRRDLGRKAAERYFPKARK